MKETTTSSTVVGALIVTIMFVVVFTYPGGNDQNNGFPIFLNKKLFMARMLFARFPRMLFCMLSKDVVCKLSQNKNIFFPLKYIENINKNIFNKILIAAPRRTRTLFFQKFLSPAPAPKFGNAPVLHRKSVWRICHPMPKQSRTLPQVEFEIWWANHHWDSILLLDSLILDIGKNCNKMDINFEVP